MAKAGVLMLHGMGEQCSNYSGPWVRAIKKKVGPEVAAQLTFEEVLYAPVIKKHQRVSWDNFSFKRALPTWLLVILAWGAPVAIGLALGFWQSWLFIVLTVLWFVPFLFALWLLAPAIWWRIRYFFFFAFSDATTYQHRPSDEGATYLAVHEEILKSLHELEEHLDSPGAPVIVVAHSLGSHVISNYVWDAQRRDGIWIGKQPTEFEKLGTCRAFMTFGCNIPLFVSGLRYVEAIEKPHRDFEWHNYYDRDDILGWPLTKLPDGRKQSYRELVEDHEVAVLHPLLGWTPLAHSHYFTSPKFVDDVADAIKKAVQEAQAGPAQAAAGTP